MLYSTTPNVDHELGHVLTKCYTFQVIGALQFIKDKVGLPFATFV